MKTYPQHGFTLLELMATLAVLGILMAVAIPNMSQFVKNERLTSFSNTLLSDLMLARSKSVELNQSVIVCASSDEENCTGGSFENGWIVTIDNDGDGTGDELIKVQQPITGDIEFNLNDPVLSTIIFDTRGFTPDTIGTISICDDRGNDHAKALTISRTGRVSRGADPSC